MADNKTIGQLDPNPSIDGTEEVATEKGGVNFKNTYTALKTWITSTFLTGGNGTTANGSAVDLGGTTTAPVEVIGDQDIRYEVNDNDLEFGKITCFDLTQVGGYVVTSKEFEDFLVKRNSELTVSNGQIKIEYNSVENSKVAFIRATALSSIISFEAAGLFTTITTNENGVVISDQNGKGVSFTNYTVDNANVGAWGAAPNAIRSEAEIIANLPTIADVNTKSLKATVQETVSATPRFITTSDSEKSLNVYGVAALCEITINNGSLSIGEALEVNIGDADGVDVISGTGSPNIFGAVTGSTTIGDSIMIRRLADGIFNLIGEVYKVY